MKHLIVVLLFVVGLPALAQQNADSVMINRVNKLKEHILANDYKGADEELKKIFAKRTNAPLPDEVSYLYGALLVYQKKYGQAQTSLLKYLSATNEKGPFAADAKALLREIECAETGYYTRLDTCLVCHGEGRLIDKCPNCNGKGQEFCRACNGSGVAASSNGFGSAYTTCNKCQGKGYFTCTVCHGTKQQKRLCNSCNGEGMAKFKQKCKK